MGQIIYNPVAGTQLNNAIDKAIDIQEKTRIKTSLNFNEFLMPVASILKMRADYYQQLENQHLEFIDKDPSFR